MSFYRLLIIAAVVSINVVRGNHTTHIVAGNQEQNVWAPVNATSVGNTHAADAVTPGSTGATEATTHAATPSSTKASEATTPTTHATDATTTTTAADTSATIPATINATSTTTHPTNATTTTTAATTSGTPATSTGAPPKKPERDSLNTKPEANNATASCSAENWAKTEWASLDKMIANTTTEHVLTMTADLCGQTKMADSPCLNDTLNNGSDSSAIFKSKAVKKMRTQLCKNNRTDIFTLTVNGTTCVTALNEATTNCSGTKNGTEFPLEYFLRAHSTDPEECKKLNSTRNCMVNSLANEKRCSSEQQRVWAEVVRHFVPPSCEALEVKQTPAPPRQQPSTIPKSSSIQQLANPVLCIFLPVLLKFASQQKY